MFDYPRHCFHTCVRDKPASALLFQIPIVELLPYSGSASGEGQRPQSHILFASVYFGRQREVQWYLLSRRIIDEVPEHDFVKTYVLSRVLLVLDCIGMYSTC